MTAHTETAAGLRVLVTDHIIGRFEPLLTSHGTDGHTWTMAAGWPEQRMLAALPDTDVLVCTRMSPAMARAGTNLRLVHVAGAGYDNIPLDLLAPEVAVANTFNHGRSIAEHVLMCAMMLARRTLTADREMRDGVWRTVATDPRAAFGATVLGRTLGLIGLGEIGLETARLATAMGMRVRAVRHNPAAPVPGEVALDWVGGVGELDLLLKASDVVVVTVPLNEDTHGLVGEREFRAMRPSAFLINVARGPIVDEAAAYAALSTGVIAGAAFDVWWGGRGGPEPPSRLPFGELPNVILTPHHSGHTRDTFEGRARDIAANIERLAQGRPLANLVRT
ncbi:2-hydroxyacid dehydrogenase [Nonomuraea sp. NPDC050153]|uniref:2-hydroxyacid dehydrogenase n=1 Tax=Nonomuraea sp. NPDC050153 TaxID=3364359 RepID=UPI003796CEC4